jgi:hypothetical protein
MNLRGEIVLTPRQAQTVVELYKLDGDCCFCPRQADMGRTVMAQPKVVEGVLQMVLLVACSHCNIRIKRTADACKIMIDTPMSATPAPPLDRQP